MFGIGGFEFFIILLFGFLIFGPDKLPEIAKTVGTAMSKFKKAQDEMSAVLKSEVMEASAEADKKTPQTKTEGNSSAESAAESFAERKARYDKERAERKKQQKLEENRAAMRKDSAEHARKLEEQAKDHAQQTDEQSQENPEKDLPAIRQSEQSTITADQLYGNVPMTSAPQPVQQATEDKGE